jgi:hypothetical protein
MERRTIMKRIAAFVFIGALLTLPIGMGYAKSRPLAEWLIEPGGSPPVITNWFASEELNPGDIWKIYLEANDPDGDIREFVCIFDQIGYGSYSPHYVVVKKQHREELRGYLNFFSSAGGGHQLPEWTQLSLTVFIRDKGGNASNKVVFPLLLSLGAKQGPPPSPFDIGGLGKLGTITVQLVNPEWARYGMRMPWWIEAK